MTQIFTHAVRIYIEDTDAGGIVYHANYLKFAERARTEVLRTLGFSKENLMRDHGVRFVVYACELNCLAPAFLDDILEVKTELKVPTAAKLMATQTIMRGDTPIAILEVGVACINPQGRPIRIIKDLYHLLTPET